MQTTKQIEQRFDELSAQLKEAREDTSRVYASRYSEAADRRASIDALTMIHQQWQDAYYALYRHHPEPCQWDIKTMAFYGRDPRVYVRVEDGDTNATTIVRRQLEICGYRVCPSDRPGYEMVVYAYNAQVIWAAQAALTAWLS